MIKVNSVDLTRLINACFDLAADDALTTQQQAAWMTVGKRLRGALMNVLTAQFEDGTQKVKDANEELKRLNRDLKAATTDLEGLSETLAAAKALANTLDSVLKLAVGFV